MTMRSGLDTRTKSIFVILSGAIFVLLRTVQGEGVPLGAGESRDYALVLCEGFLANRDRFKAFTCRGIVGCGWARSVEEALAEGLLQAGKTDEPPMEFLWVKSGPEYRYSLVDVPGKRSHTGGSMWCYQPGERVGNDIYRLTLGPWGNFVGDYQTAPSKKDPGATPWTPGCFGGGECQLLCYVKKSLTAPGTIAKVTVVKNVMVRNRTTTMIQLTQTVKVGDGKSEEAYEKYYVDESRGYIPIWAENSSGRWIAIDVEYVAGKGWWPMRWVTNYLDNDRRAKDDPAVRGHELRVTEIVVGKPKPDDLRIAVPARTRLAVRLGSLPNSNERPLGRFLQLARPAQVRGDTIAALLAEHGYDVRRPPLFARILSTLAVAVAVVASIGVYMWYRIRGRRKR